MLQQELSVATLQCQSPGGSRAYEGAVRQLPQQVPAASSRPTDARMQQIAGRKRFNVDVVVTEFANRTAQRAPVDKEFCSRSKRALEWALSTQGRRRWRRCRRRYDLGPEMNIHPCPAPVRRDAAQAKAAPRAAFFVLPRSDSLVSGRPSCAMAQQAAGMGVGRLAVADRDLAVHQDVAVALGALDAPPFAARQVVRDLVGQHFRSSKS